MVTKGSKAVFPKEYRENVLCAVKTWIFNLNIVCRDL